MTKHLLFFVALFILPSFGFGQLTFDWAFQTGSSKSDLVGPGMKDSEGNLYVLGIYRDTTDLDPGMEEVLAFPFSANFIALSAYSSDGEYLNSAIFNAGENSGGGLLEIKDDKIKLILYFTDSLVYYREGESTLIDDTDGQQVCFLTLDTDGQILDHFIFPYLHPIYVSKLHTFQDGSQIVAGGFVDTFAFDPGSGSHTVISNGEYDVFVAKLSSSHEVQWINSYGSSGDDYIEDIFPNQDQVYFAIIHEDTLSISVNGELMGFPSNGDDNNVFGSMDMSGTIQSAFRFGGDLGDQIRNIVADNDGYMYISGYFEGAVNFQHPSGTPEIYVSDNDTDGFVSKYDSDGNLLWTRIFTCSGYGGIYTMSLARGNELYLSGSFTGSADLDPGPDSIVFDGGARGYICAVKLTTEGELKWAYYFPGNDFAGIRSVVLGAQNRVFIQGYLFDSLDCNPAEEEAILASYGGSDIFVIGLSEENIISGTTDLFASSLLVYPNPSSDEWHVKCDHPIQQVAVYRMDGTRLPLQVKNSTQECVINLDGLAPGVYVVQTLANGHWGTAKVIKQ